MRGNLAGGRPAWIYLMRGNLAGGRPAWLCLMRGNLAGGRPAWIYLSALLIGKWISGEPSQVERCVGAWPWDISHMLVLH